MKTIASVALILALALASACAPKVNDPADIEAIKQLMDGYFKAANAKDTSALDAVLTDKTILLEPHMKPLVGRDAIGKLHQAFLAGFDTDAKGPAVEVRVAGDLAVAYGRYEETITPKDRSLAAERASGHWLAMLERQGSGGWKWGWVIANSDQPLPGTTAGGVEEQALMEIERGFITAVKDRDTAYFDRVLAKEYTLTVDGTPVDMAAQLADIKAGAFEVDSMAVRDMRAHVVGTGAIVSMAAENRGRYKGQPFAERVRGVDLFVKRDGRWQAVHSQMTRIKE
jgi:uncharacterized protein (TIGR02246 family)